MILDLLEGFIQQSSPIVNFSIFSLFWSVIYQILVYFFRNIFDQHDSQSALHRGFHQYRANLKYPYHEISATTVSVIHGFLSGLLGCFSLIETLSVDEESPLYEKPRYRGISMSVTAGYFLYDFFFMVFNRKLNLPQLSLYVHHALGFFMFSVSVYFDMGYFFTIGWLATELTTPFNHFRTILLNSGAKNTDLFAINSLVLISLWIVIRWGILFPTLYYMYVRCVTEISEAHLVVQITIWAGGTMMCLLNIVWGIKLLQSTIRAVRRQFFPRKQKNKSH